MTLPTVVGHNKFWQRARLFMVGFFFLVAAFPAGIGLFLVQRLFNLRTPDLLRTVTSYVSGVKLFNQRSRYGPGFALHPANEDFLDNLDEPPRVSVRRRMIRTIATAAQANYDRWYIIAHSQGTIPAFNGLMESPYAWPGYFDEAAWRAFCSAGFGGSGTTVRRVTADPTKRVAADTMPRRPVWAIPDEVAYRGRMDLQGILQLAVRPVFTTRSRKSPGGAPGRRPTAFLIYYQIGSRVALVVAARVIVLHAWGGRFLYSWHLGRRWNFPLAPVSRR